MTDKSFGTTFLMELSLEPSMVQEAIVSQTAIWFFSKKERFSSMDSGVGCSSTAASVFQKRFWGWW